MKLTLMAGGDLVGCAGGTCPTVFKSDRGTYVVQGYVLPAETETDMAIPHGETAVEVPETLIEELLAKLRA